jgi:hypothetical protein
VRWTGGSGRLGGSEVIMVGMKTAEFAKVIGFFVITSHTVIDLVRIHRELLPQVNC